jgi:putative FmdB family regulatory protein
MPTYDYRCNSCQHQFEAFHAITAEPHKDCPECGGIGSVRRLISAGNGLIFKGSGFYITDYKNPKKNSSDKSADKPQTKPEAKSEKKAETTPTTKPASNNSE